MATKAAASHTVVVEQIGEGPRVPEPIVMPMDDEGQHDRPPRAIVRVGDTVRRPTCPWSPSIHALLEHLEAADFAYAPRFLGIDEDGREILRFIDGDSGSAGWTRVVPESGLRSFAGLLRDYHDAVSGFRPTTDWCVGSRDVLDGELVRHGDFGPWNIVWRDERPVAILDWDHARPGRALDDLAYAAEYAVPFRADAECVQWLGYDRVPDRRARLAAMADAYGESVDGLIDRVLWVQEETRELVASLASRGLEPQAGWVARGYLDELRARVDWTRANAHLVR